MKMKFVNEEVGDFLKGKSEEEIQKIIDETGEAPASYIVKILNQEKGFPFKVNFTGAWDTFNVEHADVTEINQGGGFEEAVIVKGDTGTFVYLPPYKIDNMPDEKSMFLFYAKDGLYLNKVDFKIISRQ